MMIPQFNRIAYGVDESPDRLLVVRCERKRGRPHCDRLYDGPPRVQGAIAEELRRAMSQDLLHVAVVGAVSPQIAFARWLHTPLNSVEKSLRVLPSLLDVQLPFPVEQCEFVAARIRRAPNRAVDLLAVACRRDDLRARLAEYEALGIQADMLDHEGLALWAQHVRECPEANSLPTVVAALYPNRVILALGEPGLDGFRAAQVVRLGTTDFQRGGRAACSDFVQRVRQILLLHLPEAPAPYALRWCWAGPGAAKTDLRTMLESEMHVFGPPVYHVLPQPETFLARALAVRALFDDGMPCNLLIGRLLPPKALKRAQRAQRRTAFAMAAAGLALLASASVIRATIAAQNRRLDTELARKAQSLSGLSRVPKGQELLLTRRALDERVAAATVFERALRDSLAEWTRAWLTECERRNVQCHGLSLRRESVSARGTLSDWNDGDALAAFLRETGFVPNLARKDADSNGRIPFTLSGSRVSSTKGAPTP